MTTIWSEETRRYLAEERALENFLEAEWEEGRREAYDRDFEDTDAEVTEEAQALFEWVQGMRP